MKIAHYISDLLYEHECVVIPGLGGFISKDHSAAIHPQKHQFKPPYREIVFNPHLRANDGLLLSLAARSENISYQDAKLNLDRFVHKCIDGLSKGHRINFRNIGSLAYNRDKQIIFLPDENQNFMASSFGLSSFVSPAIQRDGLPEKIESKLFRKNQEVSEVLQTPIKTQLSGQKTSRRPDSRPKMVASKRPNPYARQLMFIGSLLFVMGIGWAYMNKHIVQQYYNAYAGLVPFFYASPNDYIAMNSEKFPIEQIMPKVKAINSLDNNISKATTTVENNLEPAPVVSEIEQEINYPLDTASAAIIPVETESTSTIDTISEQLTEVSPIIVESEPEPEVVISQPQGPQYLIIAGAFREKSNADKLVIDLRAKGYTSEHIGQNKRGLWMVSVERFDNLNQAKERLNIIRKEESEDYWLLKV